MWKLINSRISSKEKSSCPPEKLFDPIKSNYTSNPEVMSNIFNTYFVSIGQQLASKIPPPIHHTYPVEVSGPKNSFVLHDTFVEEVNMVINNLLVSKSNRQNDIPTHIEIFEKVMHARSSAWSCCDGKERGTSVQCELFLAATLFSVEL